MENLRLSTKRTQAEKVPQTFSLRRDLGELTDVYEIVWEKLQGLKITPSRSFVNIARAEIKE